MKSRFWENFWYNIKECMGFAVIAWLLYKFMESIGGLLK